MRLVVKLIGGLFFAIWLLASLVLFFYYWAVLSAWLGGLLGSIVAFVAAPGVFLFPLVYWLVEGTFPTFYFELLGVCLGSAIIGGLLWSAEIPVKRITPTSGQVTQDGTKTR
jgi:hypothetical protein